MITKKKQTKTKYKEEEGRVEGKIQMEEKGEE